MQEESKEKSKDASFESLRILSERWKNGTFSEIIDDWKWIFGYSARYKGAIVFYTILGILSTSLGLVGSVAGKYLIDIITGYQIQKLPLLLLPKSHHLYMQKDSTPSPDVPHCGSYCQTSPNSQPAPEKARYA